MDTEGKAFSNSGGKDQRPKQKRRKHFKNRMHLWEFLLELLADKRCQSSIKWTRQEEGEFRIIKTEAVAKLWGFENGRQGMTYDKLSRALRQYYSERIITKVRGQKTTYKFDNLPYNYLPGVTRRRKRVFSARKVSSRAENWKKTGSQGQYTPESPTNSTEFILSPHLIPCCGLWETLHSSNSEIILLNPQSSHLESSPSVEENNGLHMIKTPVVYPIHPLTPESSPSSSPQNILEQNGSGRFAQSFYSQTHPNKETDSIVPLYTRDGSKSRSTSMSHCHGNIPTPGSSRFLTNQFILEKLLPHKDKASVVSPRQYLIPKPSHISSLAKSVEQSTTRVSPSLTPCSPFPFPYPQNFIRPTYVYTPVNKAPYQPPVYPVSLRYDQHPIITNVTGNYLAHPAPESNEK
ncbi:ETS-related transcription factor Elf-4-like [Stylophora pistillata]|uniref:ETS-related transcription factor Elf-2 n=1 Tax=Stylophora pistillata TaxID=50429 RepID=A0A2B4S361_STYPI|nr:ETS-related transcription factor Elf-4-like [Stylophora pistillata]PFX25144.1 ETS-related transcription factor Elf-2 [Stylophora pistillata]